MKNLHTLKLSASSIGSAAPSHSRPAQAEPTVEPAIAPERTEAEGPVAAPAATPRRAAPTRRQLLALLAVEFAATLAAVAAAGSIHNTIFRIAAAGVAITVALVIAIETAASARRRRPAAAAPARVAVAAPRKFSMAKAMLMLMMATGIAAYFGGAGTFAGFTAETSNGNDSLASGTLTFNNTVNTNTACTSLGGGSNNNVNSACDKAFTLTNVAPGVFGGTAEIDLQNTGSLNASKLYLWSPYANGILGTGITNGGTVTTLALSTASPGPNGLEGTVTGGDLVTVSAGSFSQTFKVGAAGAVPGATSVPIVNDATYPNVAAHDYAAGATMQDTSSNTTVDNTNCYDQKTTTPPVGGATKGTDLTFNPILHNPFCQTVLFFVQEIGTNHNYCWWGSGKASATGMCNAPISANPSIGSNTTIGTATYTTVAPLKGNVKTGDSVVFTEGGNVVTCTATANSYITATSISVNSCGLTTGVNGTFDSSAVITDSSTATTLASATDTLSNFDIAAKYSNKIELTQVSANGTTAATGTDLPHFDSGVTDTRKFYVGVYLPSTAIPQNQLQGLLSTFGITWHIDQ